MSERKVLNKYYPPDFDPSKIPRMKLPKNRQYTVRLMAPFNMRCATCGEYIYKGKKFNARKEDVENEDYLGIRIYRFYIKCTRCLQEISFKTDPKSTDYEIEAGATRNFMALKLAEEQAVREEEEAKEEEASNPMKLLENRTKQSKNEIELLESLEELRDLNKRQQSVDYDSMLVQYDNSLSEREKQEKLKQIDEDYIKTVKFHSTTKRKVVEEIVEEIDDDFKPTDEKLVKTTSSEKSAENKGKMNNFSLSSDSLTKSSSKSKVKKSYLSGLVKINNNTTEKSKGNNTDNNKDNNEVDSNDSNNKNTKNTIEVKAESSTTSKNTLNEEKKTTTNSLLLLGTYSDSDSNNSD